MIGTHRIEDACGVDLVTASTWRTDTDPRYAEVQTGGDAAFAVFTAERLRELLEIAVGVDIDRVVVMDGGQGEGVSNALNQRVRGAYGTMERLASVLGLDLQEVLQRAVGSRDAEGGEASAPELPPA
ncbi:hypothetical protein [Candidatus Palauibacter sp.]|uniref:hypothetical protein n=1 Tax=Candidatus Palauibacter sp. TaxID=3101350 RepID=UPI003B52A58D